MVCVSAWKRSLKRKASVGVYFSWMAAQHITLRNGCPNPYYITTTVMIEKLARALEVLASNIARRGLR